MRKILYFFLFNLSFQCVPFGSLAWADEPILRIQSPEKTIRFKRSELLSRKDLTILEIESDPAYPKKKMRYQAVPVKALFEGIKLPVGAILQFRCLDGFSGPLSSERILTDLKDQSTAYIAIEAPKHPWPPLHPLTDVKTAGPFYLVWSHPELSQIAREEWPYQLAGFEVKKPLSETYPKIFPEAQFVETHPVKKGFKIFLRDCFVCHTLNRQGESKLGPDLNDPMSPTEYLTTIGLKTAIRNPQALRYWPQSKMHGFAKEQLPDSELEDLIAYLKSMAQNRKKQKP